MEEIERKVEKYLEEELKDLERCFQRIDGGQSYFAKTDCDMLKKCSLDRGMGVVMFAQNLGARFYMLNSMYEDFKKKVREF